MDAEPHRPGHDTPSLDRAEAEFADALQRCVGVAATATPGAFSHQLIIDGATQVALHACVRDYVACLRDAGTPPELAIGKLKTILNQHIPRISDHNTLGSTLVTAAIREYYGMRQDRGDS